MTSKVRKDDLAIVACAKLSLSFRNAASKTDLFMEPTRGELEAEITHAALNFLKETLGRGPTGARSYLIDDLLIIRCIIPLQPPERAIMLDGSAESCREIRNWRRRLYETFFESLRAKIEATLKVPVRYLFADYNTSFEESLILVSLASIPTYRKSKSE